MPPSFRACRENTTQIIYGLTALLTIASLFADRRKTARALRVALHRFTAIAPSFVVMLVFVAVFLSLLPERVMIHALSPDNRWIALAASLGLGSVSIMPGFIAYPLCGVLLARGALYMVLSGFSTSLMMIGVLTFPVEKNYLGAKLALARNIIALFIALAVALATGLVFGELP